jgi:hypothetical protein
MRVGLVVGAEQERVRTTCSSERVWSGMRELYMRFMSKGALANLLAARDVP